MSAEKLSDAQRTALTTIAGNVVHVETGAQRAVYRVRTDGRTVGALVNAGTVDALRKRGLVREQFGMISITDAGSMVLAEES